MAIKRLHLNNPFKLGLSLAAISILLITGSGGCTLPAKNVKLTVPAYWHTAAEVNAAAEQSLKKAETLKQQILQIQGARTVENTLVPYNDILVELNNLFGRADLLLNVHPDKAVREASELAEQQAAQYLNQLSLDHGLYEALKQVPVDKADAETQRFMTLTMRDYRRSGADKDEATRQKLGEIFDQKTIAEQTFDRNVRESRRYIELSSAADLAGLPADYVAAHQPGPGGKIRISTDYADFDPFMLYSSREDLRKALFIQYNQRAYPENEDALKKLLTLRYQYATTLGYPNWAEYAAEDKMVKKASVVSDFLNSIAETARSRSAADAAQLLARKKLDNPQATAVNSWDTTYYTRIVREEQYGVDSEVVRSYFEYHRVIDGIVQLAQDFFGVTIKKAPEAEVWDSNVEAYDVYDAGQLIGRIYLDLIPREGKYTHEAVEPCQNGLKDRQVAVATLLANIPGPGTAEQPALLEWQDAISLLHEFGHMMHYVLSYKHQWIPVSGINCEWDFVEVPSQLLEEWGRDASILRRFAKQYQTGEPIPVELVNKMNEANNLGKGITTASLLYRSWLSLDYHEQDPANLDLLSDLKRIQGAYFPFPYLEGTYTYASFTHLQGYSSTYYTYSWSLALEKEIFSKFQAKGLMDKATAKAYREKILEVGGAKDGSQMMKDFLGRDYSFDAYREWLKK